MANINMKLGIILAGLVASIPVMVTAQESGKRNLDREFGGTGEQYESEKAVFKKVCGHIQELGSRLNKCCNTANTICKEQFPNGDCATSFAGCKIAAFWND